MLNLLVKCTLKINIHSVFCLENTFYVHWYCHTMKLRKKWLCSNEVFKWGSDGFRFFFRQGELLQGLALYFLYVTVILPDVYFCLKEFGVSLEFLIKYSGIFFNCTVFQKITRTREKSPNYVDCWTKNYANCMDANQ